MNIQKTIVIISFVLVVGICAWIGFELFLKSHIKIPQNNVVEKPVTKPTQPIKIPTEDELLKSIKEQPDNQIDIGLASLVIAKGVYLDIDINAYMEKLDSMAKELKETINNTKDPAKMLNIVNNYINHHRATKIYSIGDEEELYGSFLNTVIDKTSGNCLGYSTLYLFLGERLGIPLYGVILPYHIFVKYEDGKYQKEIESTNGYDFPWLTYIMQLKSRNRVLHKGDWQYHKATKKQVVGYMLNNRGVIKNNTINYAGAIADYTKAIEINPDFAMAYYYRGNTNAKKNDFDAAITDYTKAIEIIPYYARAYHNRGLVKFQISNYNGAINDYTKTIEIIPDSAEAYYNRGFAEAKNGNVDDAITDYNKAIEINSNFAEAYYGRGLANAKKGNETDAIADYTKAIKIRPDFVNAYNNRGYLKLKNNNLDEAINNYNKVIEIMPNNHEAYYNRGSAKYRKGDTDGAKMDWEQAIKLNPLYEKELKPWIDKLKDNGNK